MQIMIPFTGFFFDPLHGGCLRRIVKTGGRFYKIKGVYGKDEKDTHKYWYADVFFKNKEDTHYVLEVDFRTGKKNKTYNTVMSAVYIPTRRELHWSDGNVWKQLYVHKNQLVG